MEVNRKNRGIKACKKTSGVYVPVKNVLQKYDRLKKE